FMLSACGFGVLFFHPISPVTVAIGSPFIRNLLMGLAMGGTAIALIYSPIGKQSGAHFNPAVTITYLRLAKIAPWDAAFYILSQFVGGLAGVLIAAGFLRSLISHPSVNYVITKPGAYGEWGAFSAEVGITFILMIVILCVSNVERLARFTGLF